MKLFGIELDFSRRKKMSPEEMECFGCGRNQDEVSKLIAGPRVFICDRCVEAAALTLTTDDGQSLDSPMERTGGRRCSFCNKPIAVATAGGEAAICEECVAISQTIIAEDRRHDTSSTRT